MFDKKIFSEGLLMVLQLWMACVISFDKLWLSVKFLLVLSFLRFEQVAFQKQRVPGNSYYSSFVIAELWYVQCTLYYT